MAAGSNFTSGTLNTSWGSDTTANRAVGVVNLADSTSNDWYITGVQLEVGNNATPFEHLSYGEDLALCSRYFFKAKPSGALVAWAHPLTTGDTVYRRCTLAFPVEMRDHPTISFTSANDSTLSNTNPAN